MEIKRKELQRSVQNIFKCKPHLLAEDKHLLRTEDKIIKRSNGSIKKWIRSIGLARDKFKRKLEINEIETLQKDKEKINSEFIIGTHTVVQHSQENIIFKYLQ